MRRMDTLASAVAAIDIGKYNVIKFLMLSNSATVKNTWADNSFRFFFYFREIF